MLLGELEALGGSAGRNPESHCGGNTEEKLFHDIQGKYGGPAMQAQAAAWNGLLAGFAAAREGQQPRAAQGEQ